MTLSYVTEIAVEIALPRNVLDLIAEKFGPQKARECAMSTSVGGIGPLLKDRILGQSDQSISANGITLLYDHVWVQTWHEWGQMSLKKIGVGSVLKQILHSTDIGFNIIGFDGRSYSVSVWEQKYGNASVYFLSCPEITDVIYPGPKDAPLSHSNPGDWAHRHKLLQNWILGRGALTLLKLLNVKPSHIVLSETPTMLGHHKLVKDSLETDPYFEAVKYIFNDHTPLEYAHPIWDKDTIELVKLNPVIYEKSAGWNPPRKTLDVTSLLVGLCDGVYGVAKKHGEVMRAMPSLSIHKKKIEHITNGVKKEEWQAHGFLHWETMSDDELLKEKSILKKKLLDWAWRYTRQWPGWAIEAQNKNIVVFTRRITPYKRLDVLTRVVSQPQLRARFAKLNTLIFVGGRVHQQDDVAQDMLYTLVEMIDKDDELRKSIIFVDNFNIWDAQLLYQGASGSIMMADDTREASATGFMKAQLNGAAVIATEDGAIPEFVFFQSTDTHEKNGFFIPYKNGEPTEVGLIDALEQFDLMMSNPVTGAKLMRAAFAMSAQLDIKRTVNDMRAMFERI